MGTRPRWRWWTIASELNVACTWFKIFGDACTRVRHMDGPIDFSIRILILLHASCIIQFLIFKYTNIVTSKHLLPNKLLSYSLIPCDQLSTKPKSLVRWHFYTFKKTEEERRHSSSLLWRGLIPSYILNLPDCNKGLGKWVYWSYQRQGEVIGCQAFSPARWVAYLYVSSS